MRGRISVVAILAIALSAAWAEAKVSLPAIVGDNMVLQRNAPITIWGWADPAEKVTVTLGDQKTAALAGTDGAWQVTLAPMKTGGPVEMTVAGKADTVMVKNILIGEVWVCSGQSNMVFVVGEARNVGDEPKTIDLPTVRLFTVARGYAETPQKDCGGQWAVSTRQAAIHFSAVGYFFGRALHEKLSVPIGLINTSVSGTPAELWTSQEGLAADPALKSFIETPAQRERRLALEADIVAKYKAALAQWQKDAAAAEAAGKTPPRRPDQPRTGRRISSLYYAMVAPLTRSRVAGVIWYQGEANAHSVRSALLYAKLFPAMIRDWRAKWGYELPFLFVQLANFRSRSPEPTDTAWARIRESQKKTLALPKTGMAVIIDIGERGNVHAKNKQDVGRRLALAARAIVYGEKDLVYSGPMYNSMKVEGGKVVLSFDHLGSGLMIGPPEGAITAGPEQAHKIGAEKLVGFAVAGADGKFVWADAKIVGDTVVVGSPEVEKPVAVRYGWDNDPACNLYNKEGLPASPFRTDNWGSSD